MPPGLLLWGLTDSNRVVGQEGVSSQGLTRRDLLPNSHGCWWDPGPCGPLVKGHSQSCHVGPSNTDVSFVQRRQGEHHDERDGRQELTWP